MHSLYKDIYEAINTGLYNALLLPDEIDDVSVIFHHKKLSGDLNILPEYVEDLLNSVPDDTSGIYDDILKYHKESGYRYKVSDIMEYSRIYKVCIKAAAVSGKRLDLDWVDTSGFLSVILNDDTEIPLHMYDKKKKNSLFMKFNIGNGHFAILHKDLLFSDKNYKWVQEKGNFEYENIAYDESNCVKAYEYAFDGWERTYRNINIWDGKANDFTYYPAFDYVDKIKIHEHYQAYVPTHSELKFFFYFKDIIQYVMHRIGGKCVFKQKMKEGVITSSEPSKFWTIILIYEDKVSDIEAVKINPYYVLPFFRKK